MSNTTNIQINKLFFFILHFALIGLLGYLFIGLFSSKTSAASLSLSIYPPIIQIRLEAPTSVNTPITIENLSAETVALQIIFKPFTASEFGEVAYFWNKEDLSRLGKNPLIFQNIKLIENSKQVDETTLGPKQKKTLTLDLSIAKDESLSDYYFSILFISKNNTNTELAHSQIAGGIATNVLLSIGSEKPRVEILEFSAPFLPAPGSVPFTISIQNEGKHFITAKGTILIKNIFGKTIDKLELPAINVLAERSRLQKYFWQKSPFFGAYTSTLILNLSENSPPLIKTTSFFIFPIKVIIAMAIVLAIILVVRKRMDKS